MQGMLVDVKGEEETEKTKNGENKKPEEKNPPILMPQPAMITAKPKKPRKPRVKKTTP